MKKNVLLTSQQRLEVDEQWSIVRGYHDSWLSERLRFEAESSRLAEQLQREQTEREVKSSLLAKERDEVREKKQWGLYRNCIHAIAELAWHTRDMREVIRLQSQVIYIDRCGPSNSQINGNGFDASKALPMAGGPLCRLIEAAIREGVTMEMLKEDFLCVAEVIRNDLKTRVQPTTAWREVEKYANRYYMYVVALSKYKS